MTQTWNVLPLGIVGIDATSIAGFLPNGCTSVQCHQCDGFPPLISHTLRAAAISLIAPLFSASSSLMAFICADAEAACASIRERSIIADALRETPARKTAAAKPAHHGVLDGSAARRCEWRSAWLAAASPRAPARMRRLS